jgi:hypothetical protein
VTSTKAAVESQPLKREQAISAINKALIAKVFASNKPS